MTAPLAFLLTPVPPFRLDFTAWALRRRANNAIDRWDGTTYRRVLVLDARAAEVAVTQAGPRLRVAVTGGGLSSARPAVTAALRHLLGLGVDLSAFYRLAARDVRLDALATRFRGLKPPRFPTVFEALINAVSCQQLSLAVGLLLLNRLSEACGLPCPGAAGPAHAFPRPEDLAGVRPEALRALGYSQAKAETVLRLARLTASGELDLEGLAALEDEAALARLTGLRGVGRWTAEYVLLRGLGRLHLFPGDDIGARNRLRRWLHLREPLDYERVRRLLRRWRPYAGLVYLHMLLDGLAEAKLVSPATIDDREARRRDGVGSPPRRATS